MKKISIIAQNFMPLVQLLSPLLITVMIIQYYIGINLGIELLLANNMYAPHFLGLVFFISLLQIRKAVYFYIDAFNISVKLNY